MANPFDLLTAGSFSDDEGAGLDAGREEGAPNDPWVGEDFTDEGVGTTEEDPWCQLTDLHCRATFTDAKQGITRICGNFRVGCNRRGHTTKRAPRGPPGFYATLTPLSKLAKADGDFRIYKSEEMMEAELHGAEALLRQEMENLAASSAYAKPDAAEESRVTANRSPEDAAVQNICTISDRMETTFDQAAVDALASPSPPPRVGLAERVRQSLRSASRVGISRVSSDETQDGLSRARGVASTYMQTIREASGLVTASPRKFSPEQDRIAKRQAQLDEQVRVFQALKAAEQDELDRRYQEEVDQEEESLRFRQAAAKYAQAEDLSADMKPAAVPTSRVSPVRQQQHHASRHPGSLKAPPHEVAAQQELAALRAKVAAQEFALDRIRQQELLSAGPTIVKFPPPHQEDKVAALEAQIAHMKRMGRRGDSTVQPSGSGATPTYYDQPYVADPQVARFQAQNAAFKARLAGQGQRSFGLPPESGTAYKEHLTQLLADFEEQERVQDSHRPQLQVAEGSVLSPEARRIAELEATIQLMSVKLDGLTKVGHTGAGGRLEESSVRPPGASTTTPALGPSTVSASGRFSFEDIVTAKKDDSDGDKIF